MPKLSPRVPLEKTALSKRVAVGLAKKHRVTIKKLDRVAQSLSPGGTFLGLSPALRREVMGRALKNKDHALSRLLTRTRLGIREHADANRRVSMLRRAGHFRLKDGSYAVVSPWGAKNGVVSSYLAPYMRPKGRPL